MNSANKALWYIETQLAEALSLDAVAAACGVSRFHLTRAFGATTGYSIMRRTVGTIWNKWLPESGREAEDAPDFERYQDFDPERGTGTIEIWVPLKR